MSFNINTQKRKCLNNEKFKNLYILLLKVCQSFIPLTLKDQREVSKVQENSLSYGMTSRHIPKKVAKSNDLLTRSYASYRRSDTILICIIEIRNFINS